MADFCAQHSHVMYARAQDGHSIFCPGWEIPEAKVREIARSYLPANHHGIRTWKKIDASLLPRLKGLVQEWRTLGARVQFLGIPLHPKTTEDVLADELVRKNFEQVDAALNNLAASEGIEYCNFRYLDLCQENEFRDSHHPNASCMKKILERMNTPCRPS